jgi:hypothetical protein
LAIKRRHKTGFGYIGSGNNQDVFNRRPRKVFSEIKDKLNFESQKKFQLNFNDIKISEAQRKAIKDKIKNNEKTKLLLSIIITIFLLLIMIFVSIQMIEGVLFRH